MGCDIHSFAEVKKNGTWKVVGDVFPLDDFGKEYLKKEKDCHPFDWRDYGMFGFLANVRNYSCAPVLAEPKFNIPDDCSETVKQAYRDDSDWHTATSLTLRQLVEFDYDQSFEDRQTTKQVRPNYFDGTALAEVGEGIQTTIREFLGEWFFKHLEVLKSLGEPDNVRIIFWFDN